MYYRPAIDSTSDSSPAVRVTASASAQAGVRSRLSRLSRFCYNAASATRALLALAVTAAGFAVAPPALAQGTGEIIGRVRDANTNTYLNNVAVSITDLDRQTTTLSGGEFSFSNVPAGEHTLVVSYIGYADVKQTIVVTAGSEARADVDIGGEVLKLGKVVVIGERESQARALQEKRMSDAIMDIVSADAAGKLPDGNAAEAVRRLPGVFAEIDQNEGRFIVVRGINADLNNVTFNGLQIGTPDGTDRGVQMDAVPADLIKSIQVIKAVTPDMDAQGIGAQINIVSPSAFDQAEPFARGTVAGTYYNGPKSDRGKNTPGNASAVVGTQFGGGKWGIVIGGSYSFRHYISNRRSGGGTWYPSAASGAGADIYFPDTQSLYYYDVERWRQGVNANLEYRPDSDNQYFFRAQINRFKDDEGRNLDSFEFYRTAFPASYTDTTAHFVSGRSSIEYRHYVQKHRIDNFSLGGKNKLANGRTTVDYAVSTGDAGIKTPARIDVQFRSAANMASDFAYNDGFWKVTPEAKYYDMASYPLRRVLVRSDDEFEDIYQGQFNVKIDQDFFGHTGYWQFGGKYFSHKKGWDRSNKDYFPVGSWNLGTYDITDAPRTIFDGYFPMTRSVNFDRAMQLFFKDHPELVSESVPNSEADSYANYYRITEDLGAAYAMASVKVTSRFNILAGVRFEDTDVKVSAIELATQGATSVYRPYTNTGKYTNVLPDIHFRFDVQKNWVLRAAWTNTIGRPPYSDIGVTRSFSYSVDPDIPGGATYIGSLTDGNPDLKAYQSSNFDISSEYYLKNAGIVSVGLFYKDIKNPIYDYQYTSKNVTFEGLNFSTLDYEKPLNADSGSLQGVELNYQQTLTMLPSPFDGLGFSVNATFVDSKESLPTRPGEKLPFAKQADKVFNAALYYEKDRLQARLAYTYTGGYIFSFGDTPDSDDYQSDRHTIDGKISYEINKHFTIFGDVINMTEQPLDEYSRYPNRNSATEHYWWAANFGVNWKL